MSFKNILLEVHENLATITFNRPKVLNALNTETMKELGQAIQEIALNQEIRGVILTGSGEKAFIAGADINEFSSLSPAQARDLAHLGQRITRDMELLGVPVLGVINGYALGGGFEVALACDFLIASDHAQMGLPEVTLGLIPGWGGTQRLARLIGPNRARQLVLSGEKIKAKKALEWGIVNEVHPQTELLARGKEILSQMASNSPFAIFQAKRSLNEGLQSDLDRGLMLEQNYFGLCFTTEDLKEGVCAFSEKRKPQFKGK